MRAGIFVLLLVVLALPAVAADEPALPDAARALVDDRVNRGVVSWEDGEIAGLHRELILADSLEPALDYLESIVESSGQPDARRLAARWVAAGLLARRGDANAALFRVRRVVETEPSFAARFEEAFLYDRVGQIRNAREAYGKLLEASLAPEAEERIRLRLALLGEGRDDQAVEDLVEFAKDRPGFRNRAGLVLALQGRAKEALLLFSPDGEGKARFREEVRFADLALAADEPERAGEHAWRALGSATTGRDRRYALAILAEVARSADAAGDLIDRFAAAPDLDEDSRKAWIDLLRETGRADEAIALFRASAGGKFTTAMRRELLEICREAGREELLVSTFEEMIRDDRSSVEWREGLARYHLERGDPAAAQAVFADFRTDELLASRRLVAARALMNLGLDEKAIALAETNLSEGRDELGACLFLFELHRVRGRMDRAEASLGRMDSLAETAAPERRALAEAWERIGRRDEAVRVLTDLRAALGAAGAAEDLDMRLAWLLSETGDDEGALALWRELWGRVEAVARRRYVEDRLLAAASRLGELADVAIELEEKLAEGSAGPRDTALLVRLYTKANDAVSAAEIVEEAARLAGDSHVSALVEKARVFLLCTDYHSYEETIRELIEVDPEGKADYLRQLAMSQLERGKPDEAREVLAELRRLDRGSDSAEFEAGVLALAGLREEAIEVYRDGVAAHPDRIESYLLMGNLMAEIGFAERAVGMFQHLAETADRDDLFTVAIDGLLNLSASPAAISWARRITLERLSADPGRMYLYELLADLSEEVSDRAMQIRALAGALPSAGEQRQILLRELMDLTANRATEKDRHLAWGRRLLGLGEVAPPQVFLDLGQAFLANGEVTNAAKTFALATEVPDWVSFQRQVAEAFERAGYLDHSLRIWERLLVSRAGDVMLMVKCGELHEQLGRPDRARELYRNAIDLLLSRRPFSGDAPDEDPRAWYRNRNVDEYDQYYALVLSGLLANLDPDQAEALVGRERSRIRDDLARAVAAAPEPPAEGEPEPDPPALAAFPRLAARAAYLRRLAFAFGRTGEADEMDRDLLAAFPEDPDLLEKLVRERAGWGLVASARALIAASGRDGEERARVGYRVGVASADGASGGFLPPGEAVRLLLPSVADGDTAPLGALIRRVDMSEIAGGEIGPATLLLAAATDLGDGDLALRLARAWLAGAIRDDESGNASWTVVRTLDRFESALDARRFRILADYVVSLVLQDPGPNGRWLTLIPRLQASFDDPLLDSEAIDKLLENVEEAGWGWLGQLFTALPEADRGRALRAMLAKVAPSQRLWFVTEMLSRMEETASGDLADLLVASFRQALEDLDRNDPYALNSFTRLADGEGNIPLKLRIVRAAREKVPENPLVRANLAVLLSRAGRVEEGLEEGLAVWSELLTNTSTEWTLARARTLVQQEYLPEHLDRFLAVLEEREAEGATPLLVTQRRLELVTQAGDRDELVAMLRRAVETHPEEPGFLSRLASEVSRTGSQREAMELYERLRELEPDNEYYRRRLVTGWMRFRNPVRALAARDAGKEEPADGEPEKADEAERTTRVTIQQVKEAVDEGRPDDARLLWRRLWRGFRPGVSAPWPGSFLNPPVRYRWPPDRTESASDEGPRYRGGLSGFQDEIPETEEMESAYAVIGKTEFGLDEMERQVRTWSGPQIAGVPDVIDALAAGRAARVGRETVLADVLGSISAGGAGNLETSLLLALLESDPGSIGERDTAALSDLARTLEPDQVDQIRRLARVHAALGEEARAARLYRWCGTITGLGAIRSSGRMVVGGPGIVDDLVREVARILRGDVRDETIEAILAISEPTGLAGFGANDRNRHDSLVLEIWETVLGPDAALEKTRALAEDLTTTANGLRREAAKRAAVLWARAGEVAKALACLDHAIGSHEPPADAQPWERWQYQRTSFGHADIRRFFPADPEGWAAPALWFTVAGEALRDAVDAGRVDAARAFEAVAILAIRLEDAGETAAARRHLAWLTEKAADDADDLLWVADVARRLSDGAAADAIERRLLQAGRLQVERIPEVLARVREAEGDEAALRLGEEQLALTLHPDLLDLLEAAARGVGDEAKAAEIADLRAEAKAAEEALEQDD